MMIKQSNKYATGRINMQENTSCSVAKVDQNIYAQHVLRDTYPKITL